MLSEKTIELNLTTELLNWYWSRQRRPAVAIGPTLREEARYGYDVAIHGAHHATLIQFKRAEPEPGGLVYKINFTKAQDQHEKLLVLERRGHDVRYGFPLFYEASDLIGYRRRLLTITAWPKPSQLPFVPGPTGHHYVHHEFSSGRWFTTSEPYEMQSPPLGEPSQLETIFGATDDGAEGRLAELITAVNAIAADEPIASADEDQSSASFFDGQFIFSR